MSKAVKTLEVVGKEVKAITSEQLKSIQDHQSKLSALLMDIGFLEAKKMEVLQTHGQTLMDMNKTKAELEEEYGAINIDLKDGSYTIIEKEVEKVD